MQRVEEAALYMPSTRGWNQTEMLRLRAGIKQC